MLDEARSSAKSEVGDVADLAAVRAAYERDGFVTVEGLLSADEVEALRAEIVAIALGERGGIAGSEPRDGRSDEALVGEILAIHMPHKISRLVGATMAHPAHRPGISEEPDQPEREAPHADDGFRQAASESPGRRRHWGDERLHPDARPARYTPGLRIALDDAVTLNGCDVDAPGLQATGVLYPGSGRTATTVSTAPRKPTLATATTGEGGAPPSR